LEISQWFSALGKKRALSESMAMPVPSPEFPKIAKARFGLRPGDFAREINAEC
jgi:hypothetical protein